MALQSEKKRKILRRVYLTSMLLLCCVSVVLCFWGLFDVIDIEESPYLYIDYAITAIFWVDYLVFFFRAEHKGEHLRESFVELVSILPFSPEFAILHIVRLLHIVRIFCVFPALPQKVKRKFIRARHFFRELLSSKKAAYVLMAGTLILLTTVFALDLSLSLPYFEALRVTAVSCFSLSSAPGKARPAAWIFLLLIPLMLIYFIAAAVFFAKRVNKMKKAVGKMSVFLPSEENIPCGEIK